MLIRLCINPVLVIKPSEYVTKTQLQSPKKWLRTDVTLAVQLVFGRLGLRWTTDDRSVVVHVTNLSFTGRRHMPYETILNENSYEFFETISLRIYGPTLYTCLCEKIGGVQVISYQVVTRIRIVVSFQTIFQISKFFKNQTWDIVTILIRTLLERYENGIFWF